ncbi:MAG: ABC transporter ATP-binding protein [Bacillota bacterium]|nr:ABC transporter ATP-binding protein [Bacillota bacterium]
MFNKFGFKDLKNIMRFVKPRELGYCIGIIGYCLAETSVVMLLPVIMKLMIDAAVKGDMLILKKGVIAAGIEVIIVCVVLVSMVKLFWTNVNWIVAEIKNRMVGHILRLPLSYFEKTHSGNLISRITNDTEVLYGAYGWILYQVIFTAVSGIGSAILMIVLDWRFSIVLFLIGIVSSIINSKFAVKIRHISDNIQQSTSRLTEKISDLFAGTAVMKIFNIENILENKFADNNNQIQGLTFETFKIYALQDSSNFIITWLNFGAITAAGAILSAMGKVDIGTVIGEINLLGNVNSMLRNLGSLLGQLQGCLAGADRVLELLEEPLEPEIPKSDNYNGQGKMIELREVAFNYDNVPILKGINIALEKGKTAALVGSSGSGKSTTMKLLMGFYPPDAGSIIINGKSLNQYTLEELRKMIAYVPQETYIFEGTIEENIRYGRPEASHHEVVEASRSAAAYEFIMEMENGLDTKVGERGINLSGGQRQRIAIARAILKDAAILLLDEATSALDSESEHEIQQALNELMKEKTVLVIAHRLSTIENADIIYVIDNGQIAEQGGHEQLIRNHGIYSRLYNLQLKDLAIETVV